MSKQLRDLATPFDKKQVQKRDGRVYVGHAAVTEKVLHDIGAYSITNVQLIRGHAKKVSTRSGSHGPFEDAVVGAIVTVVAEIDGRTVTLTEVGDVENAAMVENDGARAKNAVSDAIKRCWMRAGVGLHLWAGDDYSLGDDLTVIDGPPMTPDELEDALDGGAPVDSGNRDAAGSISAPQLRALNAALGLTGIKDREAVKAFVTFLLGKPKLISSSRNLSQSEAASLLDMLGGDTPDGYRGDQGKVDELLAAWDLTRDEAAREDE